MTIYPLYKMMNFQTLTKSGFRDFIHTYKSLPRTILADYGFDVDELPTYDHRLAFINLEGWHTDMEKCLRFLLLNEKEYKKEFKDGLLKKYRFFAIETQKYYELIQVILKSDFGKSNILLPEHWKYCIAETLFYISEFQRCESNLLDLGILGKDPTPILSKSKQYKISQFFRNYFEEGKQSRIFQRNDAGKLVDTNTLKVSELDITRFVLKEPTEPQPTFYVDAFRVPEPDYITSQIIRLGILGRKQDSAIADAMEVWAKAKDSRTNEERRNKELITFRVKDDSLIFGKTENQM